MVMLIAAQFYSPQSAFVNRGVGGDAEGGGFAGAGGFFRPPGTFSFTTGNVYFFSFLVPWIFYFFMNIKNYNKWLIIASAFALIAAIPLSISRSLIFNFGITAMVTSIAAVRKTKYVGKIITFGAMALLALVILSQTSFFKTSTGALTERMETAGEAEGGAQSILLDRYLGGMLTPLSNAMDNPFFGYGVGMGTNVGAQLLRGNTNGYLIAEDEWGRVIGEMGPLLGLLVIGLRFSVVWKMGTESYQRVKKGDLLPWILISFCFMLVLQGQWAQPTSVGFSTVVGGIILASLKKEEEPLNG
jgi:hypothetical protein